MSEESKKGYDFDNAKSLERPSSKAWGKDWAKFEVVGDFVQGYIRDVLHREEVGKNPEQRVLTLEQPDGELVNVGIKYRDFVIEKTNNLRLGDPLKIVLSELRPSKESGYDPTKVLDFLGENLEANAGEKTVLELENIDRGLAAEAKAAEDAEFEGEGTKSDEDDFLPPAEEGPAKEADSEAKEA